jgi:hypothetical protein
MNRRRRVTDGYRGHAIPTGARTGVAEGRTDGAIGAGERQRNGTTKE